MRMTRRGGLMGLIAATCLVVGAVPASAAPGDGSATGVTVSLTLLGIGPITAGPFAAASTDGPTEDSLVSAAVPGVASVGVITTSAMRNESTGQVDSRAATADVTVGVLGPTNTITAELIEATCTATQEGVSGTSTLVGVDLGSLGDVDADPAPNTVIDLGSIASVTFNEQISNPDGSLTVNAVHIRLLGGTLSSIGTGDVVVSQARCGPAALPIPMASGAGLWISLGLIGMAVVPVAVVVTRRRQNGRQNVVPAV